MSLKFQTLISQISRYFLLKKLQKLLSLFSTKNFSAFGYKIVKYLTSWPLNELVKLMMLWTTGPKCFRVSALFTHAMDAFIWRSEKCEKLQVAHFVISLQIHNTSFTITYRWLILSFPYRYIIQVLLSHKNHCCISLFCRFYSVFDGKSHKQTL